ncbi:MAG TPA: ATP-dependent helicase [Syntrophales bacterium]|nr:ATP-dependent helicase [Syntrophales bacterium]
MIDYQKELNQEQLRVVMEKDGPILVIAGAGSGKTRTLTYRVARLIESGSRPERILLATFTNKAARTMLSRVKALTDVDINHMWGGTFHHIAHLILRTNSLLLGYERNFSILDSEDSTQLINTCISEKGIITKNDKFPKGDVLRDIVSFSINTGAKIEDVIKTRYPYFSNVIDDIKQVAVDYQMHKKKLNVMDFDDLLVNCKKLLTDYQDLLRKYAEKFSDVLVDEYQDTNTIQADIVDLLASGHANLMAVGDDSQSIYAFRGANFENIIKFPEKYPDCKLFKLEINYRSTPEILHLANMSIINNDRQYQKTLRSVRRKGIRPILIPIKDVMQQANFAAQRILELIREGMPVSEIAVLYRAHYHSIELQMEMVRRGIPFEIRSGIRFFEQAHIKDVTAYMRIIMNPFDELAWKRVLGLYRKIGKITAEKLWNFLLSKKSPLETAFHDDFLRRTPKAAKEGIMSCRNILGRLTRSPGLSPSEIIEILLEGGYRDHLREKYTDAASREDDLIQLSNFSLRFCSLEDFLGELSLLTNMTEVNESEADDENGDRVILSTIHQAKGLEWSVVLIIWCADGMLPLARALKDPNGEEEERRLFYVATTRAKDQLYLCYPLTSYTRGMGNMMQMPSRFIRELSPQATYKKACPFDQWVVDEDWRF